MKYIAFIMSLFTLLPDMQAQEADPDFHLYLLIGQSNMAGRGMVDAESKTIHPQIFMLDSLNQWVPATDPLHFDKPIAGVGPGIAFAKAMLGKNKKIKIGLIPCAWGGSPISAWEPGAGYINNSHPYDDAVARTKIAQQKGVLKGILWHQGESDNDSVLAPLYLQKLETLIVRLRTAFNLPQLSFVAGEIGYFNTKTIINGVLGQLPEKVKHTALVSAKGLTDKGDHLHFDTPSARELGKRYAAAMKTLQKKKH